MVLKSKIKSILIVEDEEYIRNSLVKILFDARFNIYEANSGNRALEILNVMNFDLVLTDIAMANGNGLELATAIIQKENIPRLIFLTSYGDMIQDNIKNHVDAIIAKPFKKDDLVDTIKTTLGLT
jgi:CheY-like chemotaxis protein